MPRALKNRQRNLGRRDRRGEVKRGAPPARPRPPTATSTDATPAPTPTRGWNLLPNPQNASHLQRKRCLVPAKQRTGSGHQAKALPDTQLTRRVGQERQDPWDRVVLYLMGSAVMFSLQSLVGFRERRAPLRAPWRPVITQTHCAVGRHYGWCWILPTAQRPLALPPLQEPRKQSDAAAAAILLGRGSVRRIGASSLFLFPSSIGYLLHTTNSHWLRKFTFFGGLLLRRSKSFDPPHLFLGVPI